MSLDKTLHMHKWYRSREGRYVFSALEQEINSILSEVFGYYAVEIGEHTCIRTLLSESRIKNNISIFSHTPSKVSGNMSLIADAEFIPLAFDNLDLVVASHVFEGSEYPHQVLREIDRILVPEGHCLLIGFNPFSYLGLSKILRLNKCFQRQQTFRSIGKMKDWLKVRGFEIISTQTYGFRPSIENKKLFSSLEFLEKAGQRFGRKLGNIYLIHAKKTELAQTPISSWKSNKILRRKPAIIAASREVSK